MKSELTHLLEKLRADHPDFKALQLFRNGASMVVGNQSSRLLGDLDALESYAYPKSCEKPTLHNGELLDCLAISSKTPCWFCRHVGSTDPVAPAAQAPETIGFHQPQPADPS